MKAIDRLSIQLYSARFYRTLEDQFDMIAGLGYRLVEPFGGLFNDVPLLERLMAKHGMKAPTAHVGLDRLRADARATAGICKRLGIETVFAPAPPQGEREGDEQHWRRIGKELKAIGAVLKGEGLRFGWHNHNWEYGKTAKGTTFLDAMFEEAPDLLWEADLAWVTRGGADPVAELAKRADRVVACHVKDIAPAGQCADEDGWADPGQGTLDWKALRAAIARTKIGLFVVEHDKPNDAERFARRAREFVASWN